MALTTAACSFSPLNHRITPGADAYVIFVADGADGRADLFAALAGGGNVVQLTFTAPIESSPRLTSQGDVVAFLRCRDTLPESSPSVVLMNLLNGSEVVLDVPSDAGVVRDIAWTRDRGAVLVRTNRGIWHLAAPPHARSATAVTGDSATTADSAFMPLLGDPAFARLVPCASGGICTVTPDGAGSPLSATGHDELAWGTDSVAWIEGNELMVRPLGPGRARRVMWTGAPARIREMTYAGQTSDVRR